MRISHVAISVRNLETMKAFYERYFDAQANPKYVNERKQFQSYFLRFEAGATLELMQRPDIPSLTREPGQEFLGYAHLALATGSEAAVDALTARLVNDGYQRLDGPRRTGDGYYESVVLDPEGNRIEITV
jgi:lactoylglutathione lyase